MKGGAEDIMSRKTCSIIMAITLIALLAAFSVCGCSQETTNDDEISMYRADVERTGDYKTQGLSNLTGVKWEFDTGGVISSTPCFGKDTVYISSKGGTLFALDLDTGKERWRYETKFLNFCSPCVAGFTVYIGAREKLVALDAESGKTQWSYECGRGEDLDRIDTSPAVIGDSIVFGDVVEGNAYSVNRVLGEELWKTYVGPTSASFAYGDANVYFCLSDGRAYALNAETGNTVWSKDIYIAMPTVFSEMCYQDEILYFSSLTNSKLYAISSVTGEGVWEANLQTSALFSPAFSDGIIYVGSTDHHVYAFDAKDGRSIWGFEAGGEVNSAPSFAGGVLYVGCDDGFLYALDGTTGRELWRFQTGDRIISSPAIKDGIVYFGSDGGYLYALY